MSWKPDTVGGAPVAAASGSAGAETVNLTRAQAAEYLTGRGYPVAVATLDKLACVGGGPLFRLFGRRPIYDPADLIAWAEMRTTRKLRHTSEKVDIGVAFGTR